MCSWAVGSQDVAVVLDAVSRLLQQLLEQRGSEGISDEVRRLREAFSKRGGRTAEEVILLSRAALVATYVGELVLAEHELPVGFWSGNRAFSSMKDVGVFACRKTLHVLCDHLESQHGGVTAARSLDAIGHDAAFACFLAHAASVRSKGIRSSARMLASLTGVLLAPDQWRWRSLLPPQSSTVADRSSCEDSKEVVRRGE